MLKEVGTTVDVVLEDFNNDSPAMSSILVDVTNFANRTVLLRIDDLPEEVDVNASIFLSDLEDSDGPIIGNISLLTNKQLGSLFASINDEESETNLEISIPEVPERVDLDIALGDDIYANFSSSSAPSRIILGIESGNTTEMDKTWTHGILLRQDDQGDVLRMYLEGTLTSAKLSTEFGEPDIINLDLGDWSPVTPWIYLDIDRGKNETAIELFLDEVKQNNNVKAYFQTGKTGDRDLDAIFDISQTGWNR